MSVLAPEQYAVYLITDNPSRYAGDFLENVEAAVAGGGQHRVLGGHPPCMCVLAPAGHALLDRGGAEHARVAELGETRAGSVLHDTARERDGPQLVDGATVRAGNLDVCHGASLQRGPAAVRRGRDFLVGDDGFEPPTLCV